MSEVNYRGAGLMTLLTVLFIGLKLTGNIAWSWGWVLALLWISASLGVLLFTIAIIVMAKATK